LKAKVKKNTLYGVLLAACIVALLATFSNPNAFQPYKTLASFQAKNIDYSSSDQAKQTYRHLEGARSDLKSFDLSMYFNATSVGQFSNVFQTAPLNDGLRLELASPNTLALIAGANNTDHYLVYIITTAFSFNRWHRFTLRVDPQKYLTANFDGQITVNAMDPEVTYAISDVEIGTGFSHTRPFLGQIKDASFSYRLLSDTGRLTAFRVLFVVGALLLVFLINGLDPAREGDGDAEQPNGIELEGKGRPWRRFRGDEAS
jgi:hypothetical protein